MHWSCQHSRNSGILPGKDDKISRLPEYSWILPEFLKSEMQVRTNFKFTCEEFCDFIVVISKALEAARSIKNIVLSKNSSSSLILFFYLSEFLRTQLHP